jgi:polyphenol oxidase
MCPTGVAGTRPLRDDDTRKADQVIQRYAERCEYLHFERLAAAPNLVHGVFTRRGGYSTGPFAGLNLSFTTGDVPTNVQRNRDAVVAALGLPLVGARPVHGADIVVVERGVGEGAGNHDGLADRDTWVGTVRDRLKRIEADAMLTDVPGFALCWAYGDCAPILLYDPRQRAIALVHAGWRGTAAGIVPIAVRAMTERYGTRPSELYAGVGPAIGACCYEVSESVRATFATHPLAWECARFEERRTESSVHLYLDVAASNYEQLLAAGLAPAHIEACGECTGCRTDLFYSHRREPWPSGRFAVALGLRDMRQ